MKYQVVCSGKVLSTHKSQRLAERALERWMKKHQEERRARRSQLQFLYMVPPFTYKEEAPVYTIRTIRP